MSSSEATNEATGKASRPAPSNPHMSVLGMDGTDLEIADSSTTKETLAETASTTKPSAEFSSHSSAASSPNEELLMEEGSSISSSPAQGGLPGSRTSWWGKVWGDSYQSIEQQINAERYTPDSLIQSSTNANGLETPTVEDQLRQDCDFFYRGLEDQPSPDRKRRLEPNSKTPRIMTRRDGAVFFAKYHRLNQDLDQFANHDLALEEEGSSKGAVEFRSESSHNVLDVHNSSLFYEQDGKLLMRLPRDQVRLVMDNELEPGIVSVEQWRNAEKGYTVSHSESQMEQNPPLRYVMTVPDDLYRRIVSEMSYRLAPPCCGFFKCCHYHEGEHADIRLALVILSVILTLIFIGTMEWETT